MGRTIVIALSVAAVLANVALAAIGSVISSFKASAGEHLGPCGIYREVFATPATAI
jgi:hypothetical protein